MQMKPEAENAADADEAYPEQSLEIAASVTVKEEQFQAAIDAVAKEIWRFR